MPVTELFPECIVSVFPLGMVDGIQRTPPIVWPSLAEEWNDESGSSIDGRYLHATGEAVGKPTPKPQDTYLSGTGGMTGRAFSVVAGTWKDNWVAPRSDRYGLLMPDGSAGVTFEVTDASPFSTQGLTHQQVIIGRGMAPPGEVRTASNVYAYLELASGDITNGNLRFCLEWGQPIRLEYRAGGNSGNPWQQVAIARELGNLETYLAQNDGRVPITIMPDRNRNIFMAEIGSGHVLRFAPPRPTAVDSSNLDATTPLPQIENYRFYGRNGTASLEVYPLRYGRLTVKKSPRLRRDPLPTLGNAELTANAAGRQESTQTNVGALTQDVDGGVSWQVQATQPDAGDSWGSAIPPTLTDVTPVIPAEWDFNFINPFIPVLEPPCMHWEELQVLDENTRFVTTTCRFTVNNRSGAFAGNFGNYGYLLTGSNGLTYAPRAKGIIGGGFETIRQDPVRVMQMTGHDASFRMTRPLGDRVVFDGWCIYSAVRFLLEIGQLHPMYMQRIPYWPYGPAGENCPYPILPRGTGRNAKLEFTADRTPLSCLIELVQDAGIENPYTGANVPFYTGQAIDGQWFFEPFDPRFQPVWKAYSSEPNGDPLSAICSLRVFDSIDHLRTELNFQGQDPYTGELLYYHLPMPWNLPSVQYQYPWLERNQRWSSLAYLERLGQSAAALASIPQKTVHMMVPYDPFVNVGQVVFIEDWFGLGGFGLFVLTQIHSRCGLQDWSGRDGRQECQSWITARSVESLTVF